MTQSRSPRRFRKLAALAVVAVGGTVLAASPASAASSDGAKAGCQVQTPLERFASGVAQPSRLWATFPTSTAANATTYVRYWVSDGKQAFVTQWYRSTTGQLLPNPYGAPYASGTREWYNEAGQKMYFLGDTLSHIRAGATVVVWQEKVVLQAGRFSASKVDFVDFAWC